MIKVIMVVTTIVLAVSVYVYVDSQRKVNKKDDVQVCVEAYTGRTLDFYDWQAARKLSDEQIQRDIGISENIVKDCFDRW